MWQRRGQSTVLSMSFASWPQCKAWLACMPAHSRGPSVLVTMATKLVCGPAPLQPTAVHRCIAGTQAVWRDLWSPSQRWRFCKHQMSGRRQGGGAYGEHERKTWCLAVAHVASRAIVPVLWAVGAGAWLLMLEVVCGFASRSESYFVGLSSMHAAGTQYGLPHALMDSSKLAYLYIATYTSI